MSRSTVTRALLPCLALGITVPLVAGGVAGADSTRTRGQGRSLDVSWTEYDPDDLLRLPGNVHIGYLYAESGAYGEYVFGSVSDFECDPGEVPWGGHGIVEAVADEGAEVVVEATESAITDLIDEGADRLDAGDVVDAVGGEVATEVPQVVEDEYEEIPACDYLQDRFLDGSGTTTLTVDVRSQTARLTGTLTVSSGGHGEPGGVLGNPPVDISISGGEWERFEYSYSSRSTTATSKFEYSDWQKGTRYYGGEVTGAIGAMGLADDADDASYGGFGAYRYRTVERVR